MADYDVAQLRLELRRDEGVRYTRYKDSLGYWTIGVGHLLKGTDDPLWSKTLTDNEVDSLLNLDITTSYLDVFEEPWYKACDTDARKRAILNMRFQLGHSGIREFHNSLALVSQKKWKEAGVRLRLSAWYKETKTRAERVIRMLENG